MRRVIYFLIMIQLFLISSFVLATENATSSTSNINFITLADIHFDPFLACSKIPCSLIQKLQQIPASSWAATLQTMDHTEPHYLHDTNYSLLVSALTEAKETSIKMNAKFVIVLGDNLAHNYRKKYKFYTNDKSRAAYRQFVKKTMEFLTIQLKNTFPNVPIYNVIGNNDSYLHGYYVEPNGSFLHDMNSLWSPLLRNKANQASMQKTFPYVGYYAVNLTNHLKLIVLNTVLFSTKAKGPHIADAAHQQLDWLGKELQQAKDQQQKVFIAMHIPAGIDIYATLQYRIFRLLELWNREDTERFEAELRDYALQMAGIFAGHLHTDWYQIITLSNANRIPITGTPSISPVYGNSPGFKVYSYEEQTQELENVATYYFPFNSTKVWKFSLAGRNEIKPLATN